MWAILPPMRLLPLIAVVGVLVHGCSSPTSEATDPIASTQQALSTPWQPDQTVSPGDVVSHSGGLYRALQAHTTQTGWEPTATPALWSQILPQGGENAEDGRDCSADPVACCPSGAALVALSDASDTLSSSPSTAQCLLALGGSDTVQLTSTAAVGFLGGFGDDTAHIVATSTTVFGGDGNDTLSVTAASSVVHGNAGNDTIQTDSGSDRVLPGAGIDIVDTGSGDDTVVLLHACELGQGEQLDGGPGNDTLVSPLSLEDLSTLGVSVEGFERVVVRRSGCHSDCSEAPTCPSETRCVERESGTFQCVDEDTLDSIDEYLEGRYGEEDVLHAFSDERGFSVDCVDIHAQPSLRDPSYVLQTAPSSTPPNPPSPPTGENISFPEITGGIDENGAARACPSGSVPFRRITRDEILDHGSVDAYVNRRAPPACPPQLPNYSHHTYDNNQDAHRGLSGIFSIENPSIDPSIQHVQDHSIAQLWIVSPGCYCDDPGCDTSERQTIESGWTKQFGANAPRFFIYHTTNNYVSGCYNTDCVGFVQTSPTALLDAPLNTSYRTPSGERVRRSLGMSWFKDGPNGEWWLRLARANGTTENIGYFQHQRFSSVGLRSFAERAAWGGEVYDATASQSGALPTSTQMGNGLGPDEGWNAATIVGPSILKLGTNSYVGSRGTQEKGGALCYDSLLISGVTQEDPNPAVTLFYGGNGLDCR